MSINSIINKDLIIKDDLINTCKLFNISSEKLNSMLVSNDKYIKKFIKIIYNLSKILKKYSNIHLPNQLLGFLNSLQNNINNSHLKLLSLERQQSTISIQYFDHWHIKNQYEDNNCQNENNNPNCQNHSCENEYDQFIDQKVDIFHQLNLVSVYKQNIMNDFCIFCFSNLKNHEIVQTKCGHQYHRKCIEYWIQFNRSCLVCEKTL